LNKNSIYNLIKEKNTEIKYNKQKFDNKESYVLQIYYDSESKLIETKINMHRDILIMGLGIILADLEENDQTAEAFTKELYSIYKQIKEIKKNGTNK
jgi:hypothetical protein